MTKDEEQREDQIWKFLKDKLDIHSKNALYIEAFTHNIDTNKNPNGKTNERLAYIGDLVINTAIGIHLYNKYPGWDNGCLTIEGNMLRSDPNLAKLAMSLEFEFPEPIISAPVDEKGQITMYAKALEALFGAIDLDQGFEKARALAEKHLLQP